VTRMASEAPAAAAAAAAPAAADGAAAADPMKASQDVMAAQMAAMQAQMAAQQTAFVQQQAQAQAQAQGGSSGAIECSCKSLLGWILLTIAIVFLGIGGACTSGILAPICVRGANAAIVILLGIAWCLLAAWVLLGYYSPEKRQWLLVCQICHVCARSRV
jgi:hypothetical protein